MRAFVIASLWALSGCGGGAAARPLQARQANYLEEEYATYRRAGTGRIEGQAFLQQRGGGVVFGAGSEVFLNPVTSYSTEWYASTMSYVALEDPDPRSLDVARSVIADGEGRFHFDELPAGDYYLISSVVWVAGSSDVQGGVVGTQVHVDEGKTVDAMLTH